MGIEKIKEYKVEEKVELVIDDMWKFDEYERVGVLFANTTLFSSEMLETLRLKSNQMPSNSYLINTTIPLYVDSAVWRLEFSKECKASWGEVTVFVFKKT